MQCHLQYQKLLQVVQKIRHISPTSISSINTMQTNYLVERYFSWVSCIVWHNNNWYCLEVSAQKMQGDRQMGRMNCQIIIIKEVKFVVYWYPIPASLHNKSCTESMHMFLTKKNLTQWKQCFLLFAILLATLKWMIVHIQ